MEKTFKIYPPLGCARFGNAPAQKDQVIFTPEVPWANTYETEIDYLTEDGQIKKQAQRFYIYECDETGNPIQKLDKNDVEKIEWSVNVANKKAAWYDFNNSMDLSVQINNNQGNGNLSRNFDEKRIAPGQNAKFRNPNILGDMRRELIIGPIAGTVSTESTRQMKLTGEFPHSQAKTNGDGLLKHHKLESGIDVKLGTIEVDTDGSLIFYGGDGISASLNPASLNSNFADNSNWYDDSCDGSVHAKITFKDGSVKEIKDATEAAWIFVGPPNYAPQINPLSTMFEMTMGAEMLSDNQSELKTQFSDVFPIFFRLYQLQWVSQGDYFQNSFASIIDAMGNNFKYLMENSGKKANEIRGKLFEKFRNPDYSHKENRLIPSADTTSLLVPSNHELPLFPFHPGDGVDYPGSPAQWFAIPPFMYQHLENWARGDFEEPKKKYNSIQKMAKYYVEIFKKATEGQEAHLSTRAVLETLYGGGFHPGVELTWPFRHQQIYAVNEAKGAVYKDISLLGLREIRINAAKNNDHFYNNFGLLMTPKSIQNSLDADHKSAWLWEITPGDLTKWMGIPWQSDAASCQAVFTPENFPIPVWWPANLPVHVIPHQSFEKMDDKEVTDDMKRSLFGSRLPWLQTADTGFVGYHAEGGYTNGLIQMVYKWKEMGLVTARQLAKPVKGLPKIIYTALKGPQGKD